MRPPFNPMVVLLLLLAGACTPARIPEPATVVPQTSPVQAPIIATTVPPTAATSPEPSFTAPANTFTPQPSDTAALPSATPVAPDIPSPEATPVSPTSGSRLLAFLQDGDIYFLDNPSSRPYQLTLAGDILSFAWSPDGERLAAFNGRSLCFYHRDGSIRTACLELGLDEGQAQIERRIVWSPDARWIVLWNPINPQDEGSIGWLIVALDTSDAMWRIQDPVDWGAPLSPNNEPGGFTGEPLFLSEDRLIGTLSHRYLCGTGSCRYQLFELNLSDLSPVFQSYPNHPEEGWSEGQGLLLSPDGSTLTNYGSSVFSCESVHTFIDRFNLDTSERQTFALESLAVVNFAPSPDEQSVLLANVAGCSPVEVETWSQACGLSPGAEVLPMQLWEPGAAGELQSLVPGLAPVWSPDGKVVAFESCLSPESGGEWSPSPATPVSIYLRDTNGTIQLISPGRMPAWQPR